MLVSVFIAPWWLAAVQGPSVIVGRTKLKVQVLLKYTFPTDGFCCFSSYHADVGSSVHVSDLFSFIILSIKRHDRQPSL